MEETSTNEGSPRPHQRAKSMILTWGRHEVQCTCNLSRRSIIFRGYHSFLSRPTSESCWRVSQWLRNISHTSEEYEGLVESVIDTPRFEESARQIELDVRRTFPEEAYFMTATGQGALRRCLLAFSKYDLELGYVQGMNFIMASLLWHASESDAFWLFVRLMEDFELRDVYLPKLPGLSKHSQIIEILVIDFLPELHSALALQRISSETYAAEWCFTLFASIVPIRHMQFVLDGFFHKGWVYFYSAVVLLLRTIDTRCFSNRDIVSLKIGHYAKTGPFAVLELPSDWKSFNLMVDEVEIDEAYIKELHLHFNTDTAQFVLKAK